jgi:calcium/calmodulin-dependent protein kinase I
MRSNIGNLEGNSNLYDVLQEVKLMRKLSHKNIIKLLDFYEERDRYLLVMDMAAGNDLFTRVTARSYSEDEARRVFRNLLETIQYMHSHHVIHRDIKPENILMKSIDDPCDIYLADFGFAVEHEGEDLQEVVGTLQYAGTTYLLL